MVSVGELLSKERQKKGLTLKQIEKDIRVRENFLKAIEENNWSLFSSKIYITGIIKNYAKYLGLDPEKMIIFFRRDYEKKDDVKFKKRESTQYLHPQTKRLVYVGLFLVFFVFFLYFVYQLSLFFSPPKVMLLSPSTSHFKSVSQVKIVGRTDKDASITIFGEKVYPDTNGIFEYEFPLKEKNNKLVIEVVGANGKKTVIEKNFTLD
jgi:cytoskeletal protein RodZ